MDRNVQRMKRPRNETSMERIDQGTNRPKHIGNEMSWERKVHKPYCFLFPKIGGHPKLQSLLSQEWVSYRLQIWPVHWKGLSEQKPIKNFGEKGAWAFPGTAQSF